MGRDAIPKIRGCRQWHSSTGRDIMRRFQHKPVAILVAVLMGTAIFWLNEVVAQQDIARSAFELRPGVIVHPQLGLVYAMSGERGINAVDLANGSQRWSTNLAAKPLALVGDLLIGQVEPSGAGTTLQIVTLNTRQQGQRVVTGSIELPAGVRASIGETVSSSFVATARGYADDVLVSWEYSERYVKGIDPEDSVVAVRDTLGVLRMNPSSGTMAPVRPQDVPPARAPRSPDLSVAERLPGVPSRQYLSADGRHVLVSERIADDRTWDKYRWTIYERSTARRVGEVRSHLSLAPFFVHDSLLIYETGPYLRHGEAPEPPKLRAVSLDSGQEAWSTEIRDTVYRGPFRP